MKRRVSKRMDYEDLSKIKAGSVISDKIGEIWTVLSTDKRGIIVESHTDEKKFFLAWDAVKTFGSELIIKETEKS